MARLRIALTALLTFVVAAVAVHSVASVPTGRAKVTRRSVTVRPALVPAARRLVPGGTGDVGLVVTNTGTVPLTIVGFVLPPSNARAGAYRDASRTRKRAGCGPDASGVRWTGTRAGATTVRRLPHALLLRPGAHRTLLLARAATMASSSPRACAASYLALPTLRGVVTRAGRLPAD